MGDYSFQADLIDRVNQSLSEHQTVILGACVGAGKTIMANKIASNYKKVLVLAHGQDILRKQFHDESVRHYGDGARIVESSCKLPRGA